MKNVTAFFLLTLILSSTTTAFGAGTVRWTGATNSEWSTATNWSIITGTPSTPPGSADTVQIGQAAITTQPSITSTTGAVTISSMIYGSTAASTLTIAAASTGSLTITGDLAMVQAASSVAHTINVNDRSLTVQGNVTGIGASSGNASGSSAINISTGSLTVGGSLTINNRGTLAYSSSGTLNLGGNFSNSTGTFTQQTTSTFNCNGTTAQSITGPAGGGSTMTFGILKINNSAGVTYSSATATINVTTLTIGDVTTGSVFSDGGNQFTSGGTLNLTSGRYTTGAAALPGFGLFNISSGTTFEYSSAGGQSVSAS